jgi:hypothetical protein
MGLALSCSGEYRNAIKWLNKSSFWGVYPSLIHAYLALGDAREALIAKERLLQVKPDFSVSFYEGLRRSDNPDYLAHRSAVVMCLRNVGIPD